jgi:effector-binding domain-containing protein
MASATREKMFTLIEQKRREQSVRDFCTTNNIGEASYYYWHKKLRMQKDRAGTGAFIPIKVSTPAEGSPLATIQLPAGSVIRIYHPEVIPYIQPLLLQ